MSSRPAPRLVPRRSAALLVIGTGLAVLVVLGTWLHDDTRGNPFDDAVQRAVLRLLPGGVLTALLHLSDPPLVAGLLCSLVIVGVLLRRPDLAALALLAPAASVVVTEELLKPLVHRSNHIVTHDLGLTGTLAFPSGHETGVASVLSVIAVVVLGARLGRRATLAWCAGLGLVLVAAAAALVGEFYHYATDTVGAVAVVAVVTPSVALAVDAVADARRSRARPTQTR